MDFGVKDCLIINIDILYDYQYIMFYVEILPVFTFLPNDSTISDSVKTRPGIICHITIQSISWVQHLEPWSVWCNLKNGENNESILNSKKHITHVKHDAE